MAISVAEQLAADGYCILGAHNSCDILQDAAEIIRDWFVRAPKQQKLDAAASPTDVAAGTGRGYFSVPAKEVFEVSQTWRGSGVGADLRLAAKSAYFTLQQVACDAADAVLGQSYDLKATQRLNQLLGQQPHDQDQLHNNSVLHMNMYRLTGLAATAVEESGGLRLQGCEAHVDKGLLTVIYATGSGLEVFSRDGIWTPVNPSPGQLVILVGHTLSFMTAGRLPAALHRVRLPAVAAAAGDAGISSGCRLSLCFKLRANSDVLVSPAEVTGTRPDQLPLRYRVPKTTQQLLAEFDATHTSIHSAPAIAAAPQQPQPLQLIPRLAAAAAARGCTQSMFWASTASCSLDQAQKRQRLHQTVQDMTQARNQEVLHIKVYHHIRGDDDSGCMARQLIFKVRPNTKLGKVMEVYCAQTNIKFDRFLWDGIRLYASDTPRCHDMEDGEEILATMEQLGD